MASVGFRWLDILEKEFDKAFVDLDLSISKYSITYFFIISFLIQLSGRKCLLHKFVQFYNTCLFNSKLILGELESEDPDLVYNVRQKICTLSSCFAQLTHKAQTIFQNSAKVEVSPCR